MAKQRGKAAWQSGGCCSVLLLVNDLHLVLVSEVALTRNELLKRPVHASYQPLTSAHASCERGTETWNSYCHTAQPVVQDAVVVGNLVAFLEPSSEKGKEEEGQKGDPTTHTHWNTA